MICIDCEQGSPQWHAARAGLVTASCFADVLAKGRGNDESASRRNLRARLVVERLTGLPTPPGFTSAAMAQGTAREPLARAALESMAGEFIDQVGLLRHDELAAACSPDGLIGDDGGAEFKCPEAAAHLDYLRLPAGGCPAKYFAQVQGCMWITGRKWWKFASFHPEFPERLQLVVRTIERDDKYIAQLEFMIRAFLSEVEAEEGAVRALAEAA